MGRCENIGYLVILAGALLALTIWFIDDYDSCAYPFGYIRVAFVAICMALRYPYSYPNPIDFLQRSLICTLS